MFFFLLLQLKVPMADKPGSTVNFRKLLLNRCQKEFEKDKADDDVFEKKQKELEAATTVSGIFPHKFSELPLQMISFEDGSWFGGNFEVRSFILSLWLSTIKNICLD